MNDAYSEAIKEAFAVCPSNLVIYHTLQVRQVGVQSSVFLVQARRPITAADELGNYHLFEPVGFQFTLPPSNTEGFRSLNLAIDNITQRLVDFIEAAKNALALPTPVPVEAIYRPYLNTDLSVPQMNPPIVLYLKDVEMTDTQVTGRATFMDVVNRKFPLEIYTRKRFPSLG